ncbi:DUF4199 domain-containing protein [Flavobacteriaceae bacterium F89]|uniref:DUF4199 domain-containing protein n=1 Tax=Cerina litoralis TaxID=2874477 RepID=A0AAE3JQ77_9FLAO|nr:DUF4199 domain-containing protein [Cerina litoralis]MCG2461564.1 DUF4199 domain-containing protein [Cerina litoralis]
MKKTVIRYGTYGFVLAMAVFLISLILWQDLDFSAQERIGYFMMIVSLSFVFFGIKNYRDEVNQGTIGLRRAVLVGLLISVITAIGIALADLIYTTLVNPDFFDQYTSAMRAEGYRGEIPDYGSGFMAMIMFLTVMIIGLFVSVISAVILKRKRK